MMQVTSEMVASLEWARENGHTILRGKNFERNMKAMRLRRDGLTYQAIGDEIGVTRERVRQIVWRLSRSAKFWMPRYAARPRSVDIVS